MISLKGFNGFKNTVMAILFVALCFPEMAQAQATVSPLGSQTLGRPYWHVFAAYVIAWLLVLLWMVAISRRLGRIEDRVGSTVRD